MIEQSAESDTAVHFSPGNGGLSAGQGGVPEALNGLSALSSLSRTTARTKGKTIVTTNDALTYIVSDDIKRSEYIEAGREEDYEPTDARFVTQQDRTGYIAGIAATVVDPKISANVMLGHFGDEVLLATEQAARRQLPQVTGTTQTGTTQLEGLPLLLATAGNENTLLGEEVFAVPAYLERKAPYLASLQVQDWFRIAAIIAIIAGTIAATVGVPIGNFLLH
jgi:hypothetical protein